jgi:hypothetical protein
LRSRGKILGQYAPKCAPIPAELWVVAQFALVSEVFFASLAKSMAHFAVKTFIRKAR